MNNYADALAEIEVLTDQVMQLDAELTLAEDRIGTLEYCKNDLESILAREHDGLQWFLERGLTVCISPQMVIKGDSKYGAALMEKPSQMWKMLIVREHSFWNKNFNFEGVTECYGWNYQDVLKQGIDKVSEGEREVVKGS